MALKSKVVFVCTECGTESVKWLGKCPDCGSWNTLEEQVRTAAPPSNRNKATAGSDNAPVLLSMVDSRDENRWKTGMSELDRVLGGGIVQGSLVLIGGDPGIGKSTLLLQICDYLGIDKKVLYISGEESKRQILLRAVRLGVSTDRLYLLTQTDVAEILLQIEQLAPDVVIVDSIQTLTIAEISSSAGSVVQVRESTNMLMRMAKTSGIPVLIVGHVNKDGAIAGPKVLEHIVDAVLYFEGDRSLSYRILRAVKNRYGSTNEIGVFEMQEKGLIEIPNPSLLLLAGKPKNVSGSAVACIMEGTRPILTEVQALVTAAGYGNARRMSTGFDYNRMILLLAVLEKRCGFSFGTLDTYLNVAGGIKLDEPAADLAVCLALASGAKDKPLTEDILFFGEVGLAGEIRGVSHAVQRVSEAARLGFSAAILPMQNLKAVQNSCPEGMKLYGVSTLRDTIHAALALS